MSLKTTMMNLLVVAAVVSPVISAPAWATVRYVDANATGPTDPDARAVDVPFSERVISTTAIVAAQPVSQGWAGEGF